jgi:hypothetical protein
MPKSDDAFLLKENPDDYSLAQAGRKAFNNSLVI